tara:strand:+ start:258 stop:707 length:450 start_codon:yes stop_codon:yes gene_type:complete
MRGLFHLFFSVLFYGVKREFIDWFKVVIFYGVKREFNDWFKVVIFYGVKREFNDWFKVVLFYRVKREFNDWFFSASFFPSKRQTHLWHGYLAPLAHILLSLKGLQVCVVPARSDLGGYVVIELGARHDVINVPISALVVHSHSRLELGS